MVYFRSCMCTDACAPARPMARYAHPPRPIAPPPGPFAQRPAKPRTPCPVHPYKQIQTIFPLAGGRTHYTLTVGEIVGFDFNRELHHISLVPGSKENGSSRVCMKVLSFFSRQISPSDSHLAAPVSPSPCFNSSQLTLVGSCAPYLSGSFPRVSSSYRAAWPAAWPHHHALQHELSEAVRCDH